MLTVVLDVAGTDVRIVLLDGLHNILKAQTEGQQSCRVGRDVKLFFEAADGVDFSDAGHQP